MATSAIASSGGGAGKFKQSGRKKLKFESKTGTQDKLVTVLRQRIAENLPTMVRVDYGVDVDLTYNHFVVAVGVTEGGDIIMNDPATRLGDGYIDAGSANIIQNTDRKRGYRIVRLDYYDPID